MGNLKFRMPLDGKVRTSSPKGDRVNPIKRDKDKMRNPFQPYLVPHNGIDYAVPTGTKVFASESGEVIRAFEYGSFGKLIIIDHAPLAKKGGRKIFTLYGHLSEIKVDVGEYVLKNEWIGKSGNTGTRTTNAHLHFGVFDSEYAEDELKWNAEGNTGVHGYNASDPNDYIGHEFQLDGSILDINDLFEKTYAKVRRVMELDTTVNKRNGSWRSNVIVDGKNWGYMDRRNLELGLEFSLQEAIAFLRKPIKERKTDEYIVYV